MPLNSSRFPAKAQAKLIEDATCWRLLNHPRVLIRPQPEGLVGVHLDPATEDPNYSDTLVGVGRTLKEAMRIALKHKRVRQLRTEGLDE